MANTPFTVDYAQLGEEFGLQEGADDRGPWAVKPYLVAWKDRYAFGNQVMGGSKQSGGAAGSWQQTTPFAYPESPNMYARSLTIKPVGKLIEDKDADPTKPIQYSDAIVTVTFRVPEWTYTPQQDSGWLNSMGMTDQENQALLWATQEIDYTHEQYTLPNSSVKFASDGASVLGPSKVSVVVVEMSIVWHMFPVLPLGLFRNYTNSVNDATFLGCARGTVFFNGYRTVREASTDGTITQKLMASFKWRQYDWSMKLRDDGYTWDKVVDQASGNTIYPYRDFKKLLFIP